MCSCHLFRQQKEKGKLVRRHPYQTRLQTRLMATNQEIPEIEGDHNQGSGELVIEILNPEQLAQENQALKAKVGAMEVQMAEVLGMLRTLTTASAAGNVTAVSTEAAATLPPPEPGVGSQNQSIVVWPRFGLPPRYTPPGAEASPEGNPPRVTERRQFVGAGPTGIAGGPQVHVPGLEGVLQGASLSPTPGGMVNPSHAVTQYVGYPYSMGNHPPGHHFEGSQSRDRYHLLEERLRAVEGSGIRAKDAQDLCLVPNVIIPAKFKVPDFDKYRGTSCPSSHLTMYCRKMAAYAHDDKVLVHYFQDSLAGASLNWYMQLQPSNIHSWRDLSEAFLKQYQYNMDMAPDRAQLQSMGKRENESFKEYSQRWRSLAAQVTPSLTEKEMVYMFMETLPALYYDRLVGSVSSSFSDMVIIGERLENGLHSGKISCNPTGTNNASGSSMKKNGEANAIMSQRSSKFAPTPISYTDLCNHLVSHNVISPRLMKPVQPPFPRGYDGKARCEFHAGAIGHSTENCKPFKYVVQGLVDTKQLTFEDDGKGLTVNLDPQSSVGIRWD